jgi:hypothetical protein
MEKIVVYTDSLQVEAIAPALAGYEIVRAASIAGGARALVERSRVIALVLEKRQFHESLRRLLSSIKKSFPILQICLITASPVQWQSRERVPGDYRVIGTSDRLLRELEGFVSEIDVTERRDRQRFDWPLRGSLSFDNRSWQTHNLWALSAEGAFLESPTSAPPQGDRAALRISFQNCRLVTRCEVLDRRPPSSRLPAGFAVRFTEASMDSRELIDRIVKDALIQTLLEPDSEPEVPTLDEEDLSIPGFESL